MPYYPPKVGLHVGSRTEQHSCCNNRVNRTVEPDNVKLMRNDPLQGGHGTASLNPLSLKHPDSSTSQSTRACRCDRHQGSAASRPNRQDP